MSCKRFTFALGGRNTSKIGAPADSCHRAKSHLHRPVALLDPAFLAAFPRMTGHLRLDQPWGLVAVGRAVGRRRESLAGILRMVTACAEDVPLSAREHLREKHHNNYLLLLYLIEDDQVVEIASSLQAVSIFAAG